MNIVKEFLKRGYLISPQILSQIKEEDVDKLISKLSPKDVILTKELYQFLTKKTKIKVLYEYKKKGGVRKIDYFIDFYNNRLKILRPFLEKKIKTNDILLINKLSYGTNATIIGMIRDVRENGFEIEDSTGHIGCISDEKLLEDEVVALKGTVKREGFIVEKIYYPDIPLTNKVNLTKDDCFVAFTNNLNSLSHIPQYIFTFNKSRKINEIKSEIITTKDNSNSPNVHSLGEPFLVTTNGIKIYTLKITWLEEVKKKLERNDTKEIITTLLKKRHFLPYKFIEGDPYLLEQIPDIILIDGLNDPFFLNYKGVSIISITQNTGYLVNLRTREYEEIK